MGNQPRMPFVIPSPGHGVQPGMQAMPRFINPQFLAGMQQGMGNPMMRPASFSNGGVSRIMYQPTPGAGPRPAMSPSSFIARPRPPMEAPPHGYPYSIANPQPGGVPAVGENHAHTGHNPDRVRDVELCPYPAGLPGPGFSQRKDAFGFTAAEWAAGGYAAQSRSLRAEARRVGETNPAEPRGVGLPAAGEEDALDPHMLVPLGGVLPIILAVAQKGKSLTKWQSIVLQSALHAPPTPGIRRFKLDEPLNLPLSETVVQDFRNAYRKLAEEDPTVPAPAAAAAAAASSSDDSPSGGEQTSANGGVSCSLGSTISAIRLLGVMHVFFAGRWIACGLGFRAMADRFRDVPERAAAKLWPIYLTMSRMVDPDAVQESARASWAEERSLRAKQGKPLYRRMPDRKAATAAESHRMAGGSGQDSSQSAYDQEGGTVWQDSRSGATMRTVFSYEPKHRIRLDRRVTPDGVAVVGAVALPRATPRTEGKAPHLRPRPIIGGNRLALRYIGDSPESSSGEPRRLTPVPQWPSDGPFVHTIPANPGASVRDSKGRFIRDAIPSPPAPSPSANPNRPRATGTPKRGRPRKDMPSSSSSSGGGGGSSSRSASPKTKRQAVTTAQGHVQQPTNTSLPAAVGTDGGPAQSGVVDGTTSKGPAYQGQTSQVDSSTPTEGHRSAPAGSGAAKLEGFGGQQQQQQQHPAGLHAAPAPPSTGWGMTQRGEGSAAPAASRPPSADGPAGATSVGVKPEEAVPPHPSPAAAERPHPPSPSRFFNQTYGT